MSDFINLSDLLSQVNWDTIGEENTFEDLPEGYYLCEVKKAELKENKAQTNMQASFQFSIVEDGFAESLDSKGNSVLHYIPGTKGKRIFKHYAFKTPDNVKRFANDMLKFEKPENPGESLLTVEFFMTQEVIPDALELLESMNMRIFIQARYTEKDGKKNCWYDLISWKRAKEMGLWE